MIVKRTYLLESLIEKISFKVKIRQEVPKYVFSGAVVYCELLNTTPGPSTLIIILLEIWVSSRVILLLL